MQLETRRAHFILYSSFGSLTFSRSTLCTPRSLCWRRSAQRSALRHLWTKVCVERRFFHAPFCLSGLRTRAPLSTPSFLSSLSIAAFSCVCMHIPKSRMRCRRSVLDSQVNQIPAPWTRCVGAVAMLSLLHLMLLLASRAMALITLGVGQYRLVHNMQEQSELD